jgi:positive regulator of sigma E activity
MVRKGKVVGVSEGHLSIEFERPQACKECHQCDGSRHAHRVLLPGRGNIGDRVSVEMPEGSIAKASLLAYTVPLALVLGGLLAAEFLRPAVAPGMSADGFAAICAGVGLLLALVYLRLIDGRIRGKKRWMPQIVSVEPGEQTKD